ncbi:MAG: hypothetical protein HYV32_04925 [Candidatus Kerfeldbacteria bacterium]|nr:hypothetical protein [Candidatus Kerfeldbacteria bacterium]
MNHLHKGAFGCAAATISALCILLRGGMGMMGYSRFGTYGMMGQTAGGSFFAFIVMIVLGFFGGYLFAWVYNYCMDNMHNKRK